MTRLAVFVAALFWLVSTGVHATSSAEYATQLLAQAWMIDNDCVALDRAEREQLTNLVARAEISLAKKQSVKIAREAIAKGRAIAASAACNEDSAKMVRDTLRAARTAMAISDLEGSRQMPKSQFPPTSTLLPGARENDKNPARPPEPPLAPSQTVVSGASETVPEPSRIAVVAQRDHNPPPRRKPVAGETARKVKQQTAGRSSQAVRVYAATAETYYRERRCRNLPLKTLKGMYAGVLRQHRNAVSASNKVTVRRLLRAAEIRAARSSC